MTNEEIKLLKNFIAWQSLPFVDNLFTHEDEIIKKFDEWLKLNIGSDDKMTNEKIKSTHGSTYGGVSWGGTYTPKEQPCEDMRDATEEERKSTKDYIDSISKPTGLRFDDLYEEIDFVQPHKKIPCTITIGKPSEDCISRTKLLARIDAEREHLLNIKMDGAEHVIVHHARRIIEDMPSVTPKAKTGYWIDADDGYPFNAICSSCNRLNHLYGNYCKHCGVKMGVEE